MSSYDGSSYEEDEGFILGTYEVGRNEDGERHGQGKTVLPNGDRYHGQYGNGKRHGKGVYRFLRTGAQYTGEYKHGKKSGAGTMIYPDGTKYEGDWVDDLRHGKGTYTYRNGDTYNGNWDNNMRQGYGVYTFKETGSRHVGMWEKGKRDGQGEFIHAKHKFVGNFKYDKPSGKGKYIFSTGVEQSGYYHVTVSTPDPDEDEELPIVSDATWKPISIQKGDQQNFQNVMEPPPEPTPDQRSAEGEFAAEDADKIASKHSSEEDPGVLPGAVAQDLENEEELAAGSNGRNSGSIASPMESDVNRSGAISTPDDDAEDARDESPNASKRSSMQSDAGSDSPTK